MSNTSDLPLAVCALIFDRTSDRLLSISRRGKPEDLNLPGGKVDPGETSIHALIREIKEETGIKILSVSELYRGPCEGPVTFDTTTFLVHSWDCEEETPRAREEGMELRWITWDRLLQETNSFHDYNCKVCEVWGNSSRNYDSPPDFEEESERYQSRVRKIRRMVEGGTHQIFLTASGAGATIQGTLWEVPGISSVLVGASFPYSKEATRDFLGYDPSSYVSPEVALDFAIESYRRATLTPKVGPIGIGITASVAGNRIHRGPHRAFISLVSTLRQVVAEVHLPKGVGISSRRRDEETISDAVLSLLLKETGGAPPFLSEPRSEADGKPGTWNYLPSFYPEEVRNRILALPFFRANGDREPAPKNGEGLLLVPGTFNPFHYGHEKVAEEAARRSNRSPVFMLTMKPPHREALLPTEVLIRSALLRKRDFLVDWDNALYIQKARRYPGAAFAIGADALDRMLDPKWCDVPEMIREFRELRTTFYVADRVLDDKKYDFFEVLTRRRMVLQPLFVPLHNKSWDVSSTELRAR